MFLNEISIVRTQLVAIPKWY